MRILLAALPLRQLIVLPSLNPNTMTLRFRTRGTYPHYSAPFSNRRQLGTTVFLRGTPLGSAPYRVPSAGAPAHGRARSRAPFALVRDVIVTTETETTYGPPTGVAGFSRAGF